jgi:hypothetical protein
MTANELRIGNLVWDDYSGEMIVSSIGEETVNLKKRGGLPEGRYILKTLQSIPLTEEWLVKFGFRPEKNYYYPNPQDVWLVRDNLIITKVLFGDTKYEFHYQSYEPAVYLATKLEYVHQLQNLYFALTGEELTIK